MTRYLPPLLLALLLGWVVVRAGSSSHREEARARLQRMWDIPDDKARDELSKETDKYLEQFSAEDDRRFAAYCQLRARHLDRAVRARWASLDQPVAAADAKAFARDALEALAWDDDARERPSMQYAHCIHGLLEGGDETTVSWLRERMLRAPIEELYALHNRSSGVNDANYRQLLAGICRDRAKAEKKPEERTKWAYMAAMLAMRKEPYPERAEDLALLLATLDGKFRVLSTPRWFLGMVALGRSEEPDALERLVRTAEELERGSTKEERRDFTLASLALLAGGRWEALAVIEEAARDKENRYPLLKAFLPSVLAERWQRGDERGLDALARIWEDLDTDRAGMRGLIARVLLLGPRLPEGRLTPERILEGLLTPESPLQHAVVPLAYRLRIGEPGAREALLRLLLDPEAYNPAGPDTMGHEIHRRTGRTDRRTSLAVVEALQALYHFD